MFQTNQQSRYHLLCFKHKQRLYCCTLCIWSWPTISELLHLSMVTPSGWEVVPEHIEGVQLLGALLFQHPAGSLRWQPFLRLELIWTGVLFCPYSFRVTHTLSLTYSRLLRGGARYFILGVGLINISVVCSLFAESGFSVVSSRDQDSNHTHQPSIKPECNHNSW